MSDSPHSIIESAASVLFGQSGLVSTGVVEKGPDPRVRQKAEGRRQVAGFIEKGAVFTSISHTDDWVTSLGVRAEPGLLAVGLDIERAARQVSPALRKRLVHPTETELGLGLLELWVLKEAAFKASRIDEGAVVWQCRIHSLKNGQGEWSSPSPSPGECGRFAIARDANWVVAVARLDRRPARAAKC